MRIVAIIQARVGSSRLPGKVLKDLAGQTVLARVVNRLRGAELLDELVIATSVNGQDDRIAAECGYLSAECFRGDEADVLDRYYGAALNFGADAVVRITADCPLIDPVLVDETIETFRDRKVDYATNGLVVTYPRGLDVEVVKVEALARAWRAAAPGYQRTHVTPYLYENPALFKIASLSADSDYSKYRWTLDTAEDLAMLRSVYKHFDGRDNFGWREVLWLMQENPELAEMNCHVRQKAVEEG